MSELEQIKGMGPATIEKLENAGVGTLMSLAVCSPPEVATTAGISESVARKLIKNSREHLKLGFEKATDYARKRDRIEKIGIGCDNFNNMLDGGFESGCITEVYSRFGCGKTQLAHLAVVNALIEDKENKAIFIDSENTFRPDRVKDFAEANKLNIDDVMNRIFVARAFNSDHQMLLIDEVEKMLQSNASYRIIVVDSLTSHFRSEFCLPKGTPITTLEGDIDIENVKEKDMVLTHDGYYKKVLKTIQNNSDLFYKIKTTGVNDLLLTKEHPILVRRNKKYVYLKPYELEENDYLCFPFLKNKNDKKHSIIQKNVIDLKKFNETCTSDDEYIDIKKTRYSMEHYNKVMESKKTLIKDIAEETGVNFSTVYAWKNTNQKPIYAVSKVKRFIPMNKSLMRIIGYYLSEGSINDHQIVFTFGEKEHEYHDEVEKYMKELFDVDVNKKYVSNGACRLVFSRKLLTNFFKIFGTHSYTKHIPKFIMDSLSSDILLEIVKAEFNGDGYERKYEKMYNTTSSKLASQLKIILAQNGIVLGGKFDNRLKNIRHRRIYRLKEYKQDSFIENNMIHYKYLHQTRLKTKKQPTYNLEVETNNNYIANGVIVHNCGRGTLATRQQKLNKHMHQLLKLADLYNLVVIVTNQVQSNPAQMFGDPTTPVGGNIVGHASTFRIFMRPGVAGSIYAKLVDSPNLPNNECNFFITKDGFVNDAPKEKKK